MRAPIRSRKARACAPTTTESWMSGYTSWANLATAQSISCLPVATPASFRVVRIRSVTSGRSSCPPYQDHARSRERSELRSLACPGQTMTLPCPHDRRNAHACVRCRLSDRAGRQPCGVIDTRRTRYRTARRVSRQASVAHQRADVPLTYAEPLGDLGVSEAHADQ